jgi:ankyrin repeat protein
MNRRDQELIQAAGENNLPEVRWILSVGADVNAKNNDGETPLIEASYNGHVHVVNELLGDGADIEVKDFNGWAPLHFACSNGQLTVVVELLGPNDSNGATTSRGADIEAKTNGGNTPLHTAAILGHLAIVKKLLSGGANILATNNYGTNSILYAARRGKTEVAKYLLQQFYYAASCRLPLHGLLKDLTSWIGNRNSSDVPPLRAALHQDVLGTNDVVEIVENLVGQNPALLGSCDQDGSLPVHVACRRGASFSIVQCLVNQCEASVKSVTSEGDLPLFLACEMPETSLDTIFLLMKLYPDLVYR